MTSSNHADSKSLYETGSSGLVFVGSCHLLDMSPTMLAGTSEAKVYANHATILQRLIKVCQVPSFDGRMIARVQNVIFCRRELCFFIQVPNVSGSGAQLSFTCRICIMKKGTIN